MMTKKILNFTPTPERHGRKLVDKRFKDSKGRPFRIFGYIKVVWGFSLILFLLFAGSGFFIFTPGLDNVQAQTTNNLFYSDSGIPVIIPRSAWDNTLEQHAMLSWLPEVATSTSPSDWQPVERIIVHDTATPNNDPISAIERVQSIYKFHSLTNGWGDIGYNYLIDQQGKIYEGRFGGNGSRGAHAFNSKTNDNFNYGSVGISLIGSYSSQAVSPAVEDSLARLIGWLAAVNNFNPAETQKTFSIWNAATKSFSSTFFGPVVVGHKDVDKIKSDPATLNFPEVRSLAAQYKQQYQGIVYQMTGSSRFFQLQNGSRQAFDSLSDLGAQGISYQKIAIVSQSQLDLFSADRFLRYPSGSLLQFAGSPSIFIIDEGKKKNLNITAKQFTQLGFNWDSVRKITSGELSLYPEGTAVIYGPDKELLKDAGGRVYFIENGKKRWVTSGELFKTLGLSWKKVKDKSADYMASILEGSVMNYPSGTLVKGSGPAVYLMENDQKREFLSSQSFNKLGYKNAKVLTISDDELTRYPSGAFVPYKDGTLARAENESAVYQIFSGKKQAFISAEQFLNLGNQWKNILTVSLQEIARYENAGDVKYPDGTLVQTKNSPNVYRVENGLAKLIPDLATFKKLKLSWSKVLKIAKADFDRLFGAALAAAPSSPTSQSGQSSQQSSSSQTPQPPSTSSSTQPNIRVAIWEVPASQSEVIFGASGAYDVYNKNGELVASKSDGGQSSVNVTNRAAVFAKLVPKSGVILEVVSYQDLASWKTGLNYNKFRGNLELIVSPKTGKLWVVNELPLEEYLKGVAETNQGLHMEYLKTMAVAARTYAYNYAKQGGKYGTDEVYHITNTTADQLYKGYGREPYASDIVAAAQATFGEIVSYSGQPTVTAYSSGAAELMTVGSKSACSVWGGKYCQVGYEYLNGGVKDPEGTEYSYTSCGSSNHCVGLSGAGTRRWAALGKTYKEILLYYYPGTVIQKLY